MGRYRLIRNYASKTQGPWLAGDVVSLPPEEAQRIENQAPGTLRALDAPQHDRMVRAPARKRGI